MPTSGKNQCRVALITGGAKRIGRSVVERLAEAGFEIAFTYRTSEADARDLLKWLSEKKCRQKQKKDPSQ